MVKIELSFSSIVAGDRLEFLRGKNGFRVHWYVYGIFIRWIKALRKELVTSSRLQWVGAFFVDLTERVYI